VRQLGETTYALTYKLDQAGRLTRWLALWDRDAGGWKILTAREPSSRTPEQAARAQRKGHRNAAGGRIVAVQTARRVLLLPGAGGDREFWSPVAQRLTAAWEKIALSWPGLGDQPHDRSVRGLDDLVALAAAALTAPSDLMIAQSMGGVIAVRVAARFPEHVCRLVLVLRTGCRSRRPRSRACI
jgi:pimeloyl-ACP methyl ester carboxylesterase